MPDKAMQFVIVAIDTEEHSTEQVAKIIERIGDLDGVVAVKTLEWIENKIVLGD